MPLGKNIFLSRSQVDDDPSVVLQNTNSLLSTVGISAKKVTSIGELTRVASSMFVAIFESLFHVRMDHIIRNPQTREEVTMDAINLHSSFSPFQLFPSLFIFIYAPLMIDPMFLTYSLT